MAQVKLAVTLKALGFYAEAEARLRTGIGLAASSHDGGKLVLTARIVLSDVLWELGRRDECESDLASLVDDCRRSLGDRDSVTIWAMADFGFRLFRRDKFAEAQELAEALLAANPVVGGSGPPAALMAMQNLASVHLAVGEFEIGERWQREVKAGWRTTLGKANEMAIMTAILLAGTVADRGDYDEALRLGEPALANAQRIKREENINVRSSLSVMAKVFYRTGRLADANDLVDSVLADDSANLNIASDSATIHRVKSAHVLHLLGRYSEAKVLRENVSFVTVDLLGEDDLDSLKAICCLGTPSESLAKPKGPLRSMSRC
jgi:tetratricopeptide (TPR) repeat protein